MLALAVAVSAMPAVAYAGESAVGAVEFVYVDQASIEAGSEQHIAVGLSDEDASIAAATLTVVRDGETVELEATSIAGNAVLFSASLSDAGTYNVVSMAYTLEGSSEAAVVDLSASEGSCSFEVGAAALGASLQSADDSAASVSITTVDENGNAVEASSIAEALAATGASVSGGASLQATDGNLIVCIDPGHGGSDSGAVGNGLYEKNLTLKIAQYMEAELKQYQGVTVIMTRSTDEYVALRARDVYSTQMGADLFVSIHINSGGGKGAEVWIPNDSSWNINNGFRELGTAIGNSVLTKLAALGLSNRGLKSDNYLLNGVRQYYPDGSYGDSLSVIRNNCANSIPAILIEHGFIDNSTDAAILASEENLKAMGVADAMAVVEYYGLSKEEPQEEIVAPEGGVTVYRLLNPNTNLHHLTTSLTEVHDLQAAGWRSEGKSFFAGVESDEATPVYRLYNPNDGNHHWTASIEERDFLVNEGWNDEGIGWYVSPAATTDVYRLYSSASGEHHYTTDLNEYETVATWENWNAEGVAWKSL